MPELPEVESARRLVELHCVGKTIVDVVTSEGGGGPRTGLFDDIVISHPAEDVRKALVGRKLLASRRKGKQMWWELGDGPSSSSSSSSSSSLHPTFHFGMTGAFSIQGLKGSELKRYSVDTSQWPPKFTKLEVVFEAGAAGGKGGPASSSSSSSSSTVRLAFSDPRRLGRVKFVANPLTEPPVSELGFDPYLSMRPLAAFRSDLLSRSLPIKALLLDQSYCAGIGNWIADEVLYQSRIHPESASNALSGEDVARLHAAIVDVVGHAVKVDADSSQFPATWLFHYRWGKGKGPAKTGDGKPIQFVTVGGRTSAVVPSVQGAPRRQATAAGTAAAGAAGAAGAALESVKEEGGRGADGTGGKQKGTKRSRADVKEEEEDERVGAKGEKGVAGGTKARKGEKGKAKQAAAAAAAAAGGGSSVPDLPPASRRRK